MINTINVIVLILLIKYEILSLITKRKLITNYKFYNRKEKRDRFFRLISL